MHFKRFIEQTYESGPPLGDVMSCVFVASISALWCKLFEFADKIISTDEANNVPHLILSLKSYFIEILQIP